MCFMKLSGYALYNYHNTFQFTILCLFIANTNVE